MYNISVPHVMQINICKFLITQCIDLKEMSPLKKNSCPESLQVPLQSYLHY